MRLLIISSVLIITSCSVAIQCGSQQLLSTLTTNGNQYQTSGESSSSGNNKVRVLLIGDPDRRHAIEEASSLSLDLPRSQLPPVPSVRLQNASSPGSTPPASGYQPHSLSALTLNQRHRSVDERSTSASASSSTNSPSDQQPSRRPAQHELVLNEIDLPRIKPSWLNVSSRFKITGSSIEEIEFMMPAEYYLRQAFDAPVLLKTKLGIIEGVRSIKFNKHLYTFLSVPYAKPPVEELRFKVAQPIEPWDGVLQATKWPPFCVQPSMTLASKSSPVHPLTQMMSEDCLYLNIWSPSLKFNKNHKRPVMVWIHGGAFQYGGISVDENDGSALALAGDVVVVAMNYRISAFGFLNANNKNNAPNNVGLLDQRAALEWVQQNIKQFGGDPQQVTLFGESAGGHSVGLHMISPGSQPYFKRAIMQSGVPVSFLRSYDVNSDNKGSMVSEAVSSVMMAKRLKCYVTNDTISSTAPSNESLATTTENPDTNGSSSSTGADVDEGNMDDMPILNDETLDCMRKKSSLEILKAMGTPGNAGFFPTGNDQKGFFPHGPIMESFDPEDLKVGPQKDYLIGTNTDEGTFMLHYGMPALFPSRAPPKVSSIEALKVALQEEMAKMAKEATELARDKTNQSSSSDIQSDIRSASGSQNRGAQAHLYRPLLKTSTSVLENFMPKSSQLKVLENGTVVGNTSVWTKEAEFGRNVGSLITDIIFLCPARSLARTLSESGRNVYFYLYSHRSSLTPYHEWLGVTHHDEVEFVFGRPLRLADVYSGKDIEMSQRLIKIWSHFAYTGQALDQFGVKWPKYGPEDNEYMILTDDGASVGERYHDRVCNVYDTVISVHLQDT